LSTVSLIVVTKEGPHHRIDPVTSSVDRDPLIGGFFFGREEV
jgi:hypothetical protein